MTTKRKYGKWNEGQLQKAILAYEKGEYGLNQCSRVFGVPKATLNRHFAKKNLRANGMKAMGKQNTFSVNLEKILSDHILTLEEGFSELTITDLRKLAFDLAETHNLHHTFNTEKKMAGKKWFYGFMRRNPRLSVQQPKGTSLARVKGLKKENVQNFFDLLKSSITKFNLTPDRIFNVDESGFFTVQKRTQNIVATSGKHQVGIASGKQRVNIRMVCAVSAAGVYIPPMIILKARKWNKAYEIGAPTGSIVKISNTGYINTELFVTWLKHFKNHTNCDKNKKILLLDGYTTDSKNLEALTYGAENGIEFLQLPGHTTYCLQPLDVAFFGALQTYFIQAQAKFLDTHKGHQIKQTNIPPLLTEAYGKAATIANAQRAFRATGIWPFNRHILQERYFLPATALLPTDTPQTSSSVTETRGASISLEPESDSENSDDSEDENFKPPECFKKALIRRYNM